MAGVTAYDVTRLTPTGAKVEHLAGVRLETEGPWMLVRDMTTGDVLRCWPTHVVVDLRPCEVADHEL